MPPRRPSHTILHPSSTSPVVQERGSTSSSDATTTSPRAFKFGETAPTPPSPLGPPVDRRRSVSPRSFARPEDASFSGSKYSPGLGLGLSSGGVGGLRSNRGGSLVGSSVLAPAFIPIPSRRISSSSSKNTPASGRRVFRDFWKRAMILNPISLPTSHPLLRLLLTIALWATGIWLLLQVALPRKITDAASPLRAFRSFKKHPILVPPPSSELLLSAAFPLPQARPIDSYASPDPRWRPFLPLSPPSPPFPRLRATRFLPSKCMESWFADGEMFCSREELGDEDVLDVTWLWVNGSDSRWKKDLHRYRDYAGIVSPDHHFRENDELKYSMRSVLAALPGRTRTFHLILADSPFSADVDLGLLPDEAIDALEVLARQDVEVGHEDVDGTPPSGGFIGGARHSLVAKFIQSRDRKKAPDGSRVIMHEVKPKVEQGQLLTALSDIKLSSPTRDISSRLMSWLNKTWRVVQTPTWMAFDRIDLASPDHPLHRLYVSSTTPRKRPSSHIHVTSHPSLRYASHSEIFHLPTVTKKKGLAAEPLGASQWKEQQWKEKALPTFNSMAIESRIGWLPGLAEISLACNDDFFVLKEHAVSDFHSPLYGSVIRFDHGWYQQIRPTLDPKWIADPGELGGLYHANWLLSQRFPRRMRPYFAHVPKVMTRSLHHETSLMFEHALTMSSQRRFRELVIGEGDVQFQWLSTALKVERWREALLWTFCVAKVGSMPLWMSPPTTGPENNVDMWGDEARDEIRALFGLETDDDDVIKIEVHRGERWTLESDRINGVFENVGWEAPKATEFLWSSLDGHMPQVLNPNIPDQEGKNDKCTFELERCFGAWWSRGETVTADSMFKRLAFGNPACGDCLLMALVTVSGPMGLSAFFPPADAVYTNQSPDTGVKVTYIPPPHLPLTPTWQEADFSLANVMSYTSLPRELVNLRVFSMRLLSRYLYLSGKSHSHFHMMKSPTHARDVFRMINNDPRVSILGMNDDIVEDYETTRQSMIDWFDSRWPEPAVWEKEWKE